MERRIITTEATEEDVRIETTLRPQCLSDYVGQEKIKSTLKIYIEAAKSRGEALDHVLFYGPPGLGKTTLSGIIANEMGVHMKVTSGPAIEKPGEMAAILNNLQEGDVLFVDEIHRFNKTQQDYLLPFVEDGIVILIGATTENPYFEVNNALLSRCRIFELKPLEKDDLITLIDRTLKDQEKGLGKEKIIIDENAKSFLADQAGGDARSVLNALELAYLTTERNKEGIISITLEVAEQCIQKKAIRYDKNGDNHYDTISAFIESMKHTDPDATLYYLARMLIAGEDVKYIARRICVCASEDIGLANSRALEVATSVFLAVERIGMPEAAKILAHAALYVCCSPKSDTVSRGITQAMADAKQTTNVPIPPFLQDASYKNAQKLGRGVGLDNIHAFKNHYSGKKCMPKELSNRHYFQLTQMGNEKSIQKFLDYLRENRNN